jgi:serine/threonine-protein kinase PRP4
MRKPKQYSGDELEPKRDEPPSARPNWGGKRVSSEQSVSERGKTPVVAQDVRQEAETRENQVQKDSSKPYSRALNRYVPSFFFFYLWLWAC